MKKKMENALFACVLLFLFAGAVAAESNVSITSFVITAPTEALDYNVEPGDWAEVQVDITNTGDQDGEVTLQISSDSGDAFNATSATFNAPHGVITTAYFNVTSFSAASGTHTLSVFGNCTNGTCVDEFEPVILSDNNMTFELVTIEDQCNGTYKYVFRVTNYNNRALSHFAIELPPGAVPSSPVDGSTYVGPSGISYSIESPTNNPFYSIKFETIGEGIRDGENDTFEFILDEYPENFTISVEGKAAQIVGTVELNPENKKTCCPGEGDSYEFGPSYMEVNVEVVEPGARVSTGKQTYSASTIVYYKALVHDDNDQLVDASFDIDVQDGDNNYVSELTSLSPNNGTGIYLGSYCINGDEYPGSWVIQALVNFLSKGTDGFEVNP